MGRKKSNSANAASELESKISPILEVHYKDPLFSLAAHPTKPILLSGLATGHLYCHSYDGEKLEEAQSEMREKLSLLEKEAFQKGKIAEIVRSVSQLKKKWWATVEDHTNVTETDYVVENWKTKRHKGSCRSVIFDPLELTVGENIYSVGKDHIIKKANTETGKVVSKTSVAEHFSDKDSITKIAHSSTHPFLVSGTENGHLLIYDSSNLGTGQLKFKVSQAHEDAINHILPMPAVSAYHYLTLGSTTLSHIDIRKGIITQSDDQEDELLSMTFSSDCQNENKNDTVLVSHGEGIVTIWKDSKNGYRDQLTRIKVNKTALIDAIVATMNQDDDEMAASVWCGDSDGLLHRVNYKKGKVVETRVHSSASGKNRDVDEVGILDIDYDYRLMSAGMDSLKIWSGQEYEDLDADSESEADSDDSGDELAGKGEWEDIASGEESVEGEGNGESADECDSGSDGSLGPEDFSDSDEEGDREGEEDEMAEDSDEETEEKAEVPALNIVRRKRTNVSEALPSKPKKKKIDLNKGTATGPKPKEPKKKAKVKELSTKQLKNAQKHEHGIRRFEGL